MNLKEIEKYIKRIVSHRCYSLSEQDREDITQNTLINVWANYRQFNNRSKLTTWIYTITANTIKNYVKRGGATLKAIDYTDQIDYIIDEKHLNYAENHVLLSEIKISKLMLDAVTGMSYPELAERHNLKLGTVRSKLSRQREQLKEDIQS